MTERDLLIADKQRYAVEVNGHGKDRVKVVLFDTLPDDYGEIRDFRFVDEGRVRERLNQLIRDNGLTDGRFGLSSM